MIAQSSSELDICIVIQEAAAERAVKALEQEFELERLRGNIDGVLAQHNVTIVAVVGAGLRDTPGVAARVFGVLAERNINVIRKAIRKIGRWYWFHVVLERDRQAPPGR